MANVEAALAGSSDKEWWRWMSVRALNEVSRTAVELWQWMGLSEVAVLVAEALLSDSHIHRVPLHGEPCHWSGEFHGPRQHQGRVVAALWVMPRLCLRLLFQHRMAVRESAVGAAGIHPVCAFHGEVAQTLGSGWTHTTCCLCG